MAHSKVHPKRIGFFCLEGPPPGVGGETVLTDMRGVYRTLHALGIPQSFEARGGVAYRKRLWSSEKARPSSAHSNCCSSTNVLTSPALHCSSGTVVSSTCG